MTSTKRVDGLKAYAGWLRSTVERYASLARELVDHAPEKGRIIESVVAAALREMLPDRFALGTGFIFNRSGQTSRQIDLIVYDRFLNAPIVMQGGAGLFPIECVFAIIEVKLTLTGAHLDDGCRSISKVREMAKQKRYVDYKPLEVRPGRFVVNAVPKEGRLAPRSYIFAVDSTIGSPERFQERVHRASVTHRSMVHGALVLTRNWFATQVAEAKPPRVELYRRHAFERFLVGVRDGVQSLNMAPLDMRAYLPALLAKRTGDGRAAGSGSESQSGSDGRRVAQGQRLSYTDPPPGRRG